MKTRILDCLVALGVICSASAGGNGPSLTQPLTLWRQQAAQQWEEALPLGNGHIGAMVLGGVPTERIQFNEHTVWTGQLHSYANEVISGHRGDDHIPL